mgnify:CR=1 FL=1
MGSILRTIVQHKESCSVQSRARLKGSRESRRIFKFALDVFSNLHKLWRPILIDLITKVVNEFLHLLDQSRLVAGAW